jgi:hypothetical protein
LFPFLKYDFDIASKKASVSVIDYLFITAKFPSSKHSFEVCKQKKVTGANSGENSGWETNL